MKFQSSGITCVSHQVHNAQPVKYSKQVSQPSGIWAKSLQGNNCDSPALPLWPESTWNTNGHGDLSKDPGRKARGCCSRRAPSGPGLLTHPLEKLHAVIINRKSVSWKPCITPGVTKFILWLFLSCSAVFYTVEASYHDRFHWKAKQAWLSISVLTCCWNWPLFLQDSQSHQKEKMLFSPLACQFFCPQSSTVASPLLWSVLKCFIMQFLYTEWGQFDTPIHK